MRAMGHHRNLKYSETSAALGFLKFHLPLLLLHCTKQDLHIHFESTYNTFQ